MGFKKNAAQAILWSCITSVVAAPGAWALPADPNNAALLYYQASVLLPQDQDEMRDLIDNLPYGVDPNRRVRRYLKQCQSALALAEDAARLPACDWGLQYSHGIRMLSPHLAPMRTLAQLMKAKTGVLLADSQYRQALEEGLAMRRMAQHLGDETLVSLLVNLALNTMANKNLESTLSAMPPDTQILAWLQSELAAAAGKPSRFHHVLEGERQFFLVNFTRDRNELLDALRAGGETPPADGAEPVKNDDVALLDRSRAYLENHVKAVLTITDSNAPCARRIGELQELSKRLAQDTRENPDAVMTATVLPAVTRVFTFDARAQADDNMLRTAIEIYLIKAKTGVLPDQLPAGAPKDVFTGRDFTYEKTQGGFRLSRWTDDPKTDKTWQSEYAVK